MLRLSLAVLISAGAVYAALPTQIRTESGLVEGTASADGKVRVFEGIPFAAPPVGNLRWQAPQPVTAWEGVRKATSFGPRCMQARIFPDMMFRDTEPSEDCLYLNVWTPAESASAHLPVMVWIYGGGFQAGASSESRQDGSRLAEKGVVVVSMNYRLGIFGFLAHPELTKESPHHASGNYGLTDQAAAIAWLQKNIAAFGGDPAKVTIFGESAGSMSVSAQMASPLSKHLIKGAIGESGAVFPLGGSLMPLHEAEQQGVHFAKAIGAADLRALRAVPPQELLDAVQKQGADFRFWPIVDGYFLPAQPALLYAAGKQAHISLLAGWNADEQPASAFFAKKEPTTENYRARMKELYGDHADEMLKLYPAANQQQMLESAKALASDRWIAYGTWKWIDEQATRGGDAVYRYHFEQAPPQPAGTPSRGAYHSADIEYVFMTLDSKNLPRTDEDRKLSETMASYWTNFAKTGDPNGPGLPTWPQDNKKDGHAVMHLVDNAHAGPHAAKDTTRARYEMLERLATEKPAAGPTASNRR